jgi:eukaryotic-like serine/threonine-protein kinase
VSDDDPLIGTVLADRYRVDRLIGEGAMGRVYLAEHVLMRKRVALKVLHRELTTVPEFVQRFEREARAAAQIEHPHVAAATDFGKLADGSVFLILEFVQGLALSELVDKGPIDVGRVLTIALQVSEAVEAAHQRGIVHRDLKPDNLLLVESEDKGDFIKVLDFGIAKVPTEANEEVGKPLTQVGMVYGTPEYMAPEQALGQDVDGRADLYAIGVIMFEMLTGRRPYKGPAVGLLGQQLSSPLPKMAHVADVKVPPAVEQLVVELLMPDPKKRIASATELKNQLEALSAALAAGKLSGSENRSKALLNESRRSWVAHRAGDAEYSQACDARGEKSRESCRVSCFGIWRCRCSRCHYDGGCICEGCPH